MATDKKDAPVVTPTPVVEATPVQSASIPVKKKSNKTLWIILGLLLFFFVIVPGILLTAGAFWLKNASTDKLAENAIEGIVEKASGGQVDIDSSNGSFSVESENGDSSFSVGDDQKLPSDFPKDSIPYIKEKAVTFVLTSTNEGKKNWSVTTSVDKTFEATKAFFEDRIKSPDYEDVSSYGFGDTQTYFGKKLPYSVSVTITQGSDSDNEVSVTYFVIEE